MKENEKMVNTEVEETKTEVTETVENAAPETTVEATTTVEEAKEPETTGKDVLNSLKDVGKTLWSWKPVRTTAKVVGGVAATVVGLWAGSKILGAIADNQAVKTQYLEAYADSTDVDDTNDEGERVTETETEVTETEVTETVETTSEETTE